MSDDTTAAPDTGAPGDEPAGTDSGVRGALEAALASQTDQAGTESPEGAVSAEAGARRDESGRFAATAADAVNADSEEPAPDASAAKDTAAAVVAPDFLAEADRAAFAALPPESRQMVHGFLARQQEEYAAAARDIDVERRFYGDMRPQMEAVSGFSKHFGTHPREVIAAWADVQRQLLTDPAAALHGLAQQFGVDLAKISANPPSPIDMRLAQQDAAMREMSAFIAQQRQGAQQQDQQREQQAQQQIVQSVTAFAGAVGPDGVPLRPHFGDLREDMAALISGGRAKGLDDAYDMAAWANRAIREKMLAAEAAKQQRQQQDQSRQQAARAKAAGGSVVGNPGTSVPLPTQPAGSVREALDAAVAAQTGRI